MGSVYTVDASGNVTSVAKLKGATLQITSLNSNGVVQTDSSGNFSTGSVPNSDLASMPSNTIKGNNTGGAAAPSDLTASQVATLIGALTGITGDVVATGPGSAASTIQSGVVTGTKIASNTITNSNINSSANIDLSKINTSNLGAGYGTPINGNISLSNPCNNFFRLTGTTGTVTLPRMDQSNSLSASQNSRIIFKNMASGNYTINDFSNSFLLTIAPGKIYEFVPQSNSVNLPAGQWVWVDLSVIYAASLPIVITDGIVSINQASSLFSGYLSSSDWNTFNNKQSSGNYITALTGDGTASGPGSAALTLSTVNSNVGSFGSASSTGAFTVNAKGLVTAASSTAIQITESQVTNLVSDLAGKQATGNYITALTGDVTGSGPGSTATTISNSAVTNAKMANMAINTIKGNVLGIPSAPQDLAPTDARAILGLNIAGGRIPYGNDANGLNSLSTFVFDGTNLGIGVSTPHAPIQFPGITANRKIVLYEDANNDHQFYGIGVNASVLRYQVASTAHDHVFYAATGTSTSNEVGRIKGSGVTVTPAGGGLQLGNSTASYTPATLDYYETGTFSVTFTGPLTFSSVTVTFNRLGKRVILFIPTKSGTSVSATSFTSGSSAIPTRLSPASGFDFEGICFVTDNGTAQSTPGRVTALSNGTINIYKQNPTGAFTGSGTCGFNNIYINYICS